MSEQPEYRPCALVPYYDHPRPLPGVVAALRDAGLPVVLVDDASPTASREVAVEVAQRSTGDAGSVILLSHEVNSGKGEAVITGLRYAAKQGYTHALQVDADAQHDLSRLTSLLETSRAAPGALVIGVAVYDDSVPRRRYYGRYLTHVWVWINCLSRAVRDSMCGFRVYPVAPVLAVIEVADKRIARRMGFDIEVCVRSVWAGISVVNFPVPVLYRRDGVSHFRPFRDNVEISWMHARCFFGMLLRLPRLLARRPVE